MQFKLKNFYLSLFSAFLLGISWYLHLSIVAFFAFVPLLILEDNYSKSNDPKKKVKIFRFSYLTFLLWNIIVTWWIILVEFGKGGAVIAYVANALLMATVFLAFSNIKNRVNKSWAIWLLIPLWIAWEHLHTLWDLAWTWLTLGNVFAFNHNWIQWYEITGTSGGTLWILFVNILVFNTIKNYATLKIISKPVLKIAAAIILPILISYLILIIRKPLATSKKINVVVVQPNIDPYNDKFVMDFQPVFSRVIKLIKEKVTVKTDYLVLPETFITDVNGSLNEDHLEEMEYVIWFKDSILRKFPKLKIIVGASSALPYHNPHDVTATARMDKSSGIYYDEFNTALQISEGKTQVYHKSKLVPGIERMPFPALFKPLEKLAIEMGGTSGSLGTQSERTNFVDNKTGIKIAPVVCYESVFADYVAGYIRNGADFIFIVTNDGWWADSPGYVQHLNYARLRAIENRRQIARSANTGTSCFIDEFGNISEATKYWEESVIQKEMIPNKILTFFSRFGDLISYISVITTILILGFAVILRFKK